MTRDLLAMADWMAAQGVTHVAMESTGVYWKPMHNIFERRFAVLLVNARHLKQVPGRKSDVRDCQWIAQLLQHGLLKGSFVPPRAQRELRDLTRHRAQLVEEKTRTVNRLHKVLEDGNIKLASVATDILGVSGRAMLEALMEGQEDPVKLADLAQRQLRGKIPELEKALEGHLTEHHRFMLRMLWKELGQQEELIAELDRKIEEQTRPFANEIERLDAVPGVDRRVAEVALAEVGSDMKPFPTHSHVASWAGMCPGNEESAGKRRRQRLTPGNRWLKRSLVQAAWAASHTKHTYLTSQYRRLAGRRGRKRALVDVGQGDDFEAVRQKSLSTGASKVTVEDLREEFITGYLWKAVQAGAVYEGKYLLGTSLARPVLAKRQVEVALASGADALAHGCTGKGNDQVRFELTYKALAPELHVIAPWREWSIKSREDAMGYARRHNVPVPATGRIRTAAIRTSGT